MKKQTTIFVRNNGAEPFCDRYNSEDFTIPANGGVEEMLVETAELCLGFGQDDKTRCLRRLGWAFTTDGMKDGLKKLGQFSFHMSEREALAHKPTGSSAPAGDETGDSPSGGSPGVAPKKVGRPSVLEKLARAQAQAG
jgi:hypothetical protein